MTRIGEVEDAKSIDEIITSASTIGDPIPDFENLAFTMARKLQETSRHSRRQSSIREEIIYRQTDCLDDRTTSSKFVATMKPSWTFIKSPIEERQRSSRRRKVC